MIRYLQLVGVLLLAGACSMEAVKGKVHRPDRGGANPTTIVVEVGDVVELLGPPIPLHPDYRDAETESDFDSVLTWQGTERDASEYGQSSHLLRLHASRLGETVVTLRVSLGEHGERIAVYRVVVGEKTE